MRRHSSKAASESVDFSTLFLSLGFFIILSAAILMILVVSIFFQSKEKQISTLYSLGFTGKWIERLLMQETGFIAFAGAMIGAFTGFLLNLILIKSLNTVWQGAVQTDTLNARFDLIPLISGFLVSFAIIVIILRIKSKLFLKELNKPETGILKKPSSDRNSWLMFISFFLAITTLILSFLIHDYASSLSFSGGILMYISLVFLLRYYYLKSPENKKQSFRKIGILSRLYYSFNPFHAITPAVFIAAGLFAVVITGVNKMSISSNMLKPSGGTGGFILWGESTVPVRENLNSDKGRKEFGLDENELESLSFVQARRLQGDDASCLNLNHVASPPLLGLNPSFFISKGSFSFAAKVKDLNTVNPWESLSYAPANGTAYGIVDQTVLQWGLKKKIGDTLIVWSENGQQINIIISAGLKSSLFQGYVIIGDENFSRFFPSVSGSEVFLVDGRSELSDYYNEILTDRLSTFGARFEPASERLASFFVVTNTYLSVFSILGLIGMVLGVIGLGFILIRNFNQRKREFGLMMATGYSLKDIRGIIFMEQFRILLSGMLIGLISAFLATMPSVISGSEIPWINIVLMFILIVSAGLAALYISLKTIRSESLISNIRKE
jgi:ABC-type antimicrobial peptide transport system permease subunit